MKVRFLLIVICVSLSSCWSEQEPVVFSPDKKIVLEFSLDEQGKPFYEVVFKQDTIIKKSSLGFDFQDSKSFYGDFEIIDIKTKSFNKSWKMPWGEQLEVVNNYNLLKVALQEKSDLKRKLNIVFKIYNDGVGFRYEFPKQENFKEALITEENTQFNLTEDYKTFWIPGDWDIYEHLYSTTKLSEINALTKRNHPS
ncbi:MAG: glycoside hydrolase family 97 N-terminal domain-containing protein, partial [Polaribacter sp.]|nr:glycoside hydrolase family 97 N-terminal domain-containing protein [Polaribacter sp.]